MRNRLGRSHSRGTISREYILQSSTPESCRVFTPLVAETAAPILSRLPDERLRKSLSIALAYYSRCLGKGKKEAERRDSLFSLRERESENLMIYYVSILN